MLSRFADRRNPPGENGFTLVELVISITILGILMPALAAAMFAALSTNRSTDVRLSESRDTRELAAYLPDDAAGATSFATGQTARCGTGTALVEFRGLRFDSTQASQTTVISYRLTAETAADGQPTRVLHRFSCLAATSSPAYPLTPDSDIPLAKYLSTTIDPTVSTSSGTVQLTTTSRSGDLVTTVSGHRRTS
ncbi:MAG TPA: prepilin-type N-terminal cleavage/methylation domain-containing protein [Kineosporiaceae bacterium]|nr:prepilin-type N-terminal cleavage/methylation domain-containing protein [Kineosporiaceae bacterium]